MMMKTLAALFSLTGARWRTFLLYLCGVTGALMGTVLTGHAGILLGADEIATFHKNYAIILEQALIKQTYTSSYGSFPHNAVNYEKLVNDAALKKLLRSEAERLAKVTTPATTQPQLAFWINAYNFYTLKAVADHYPVRSMKKIGWKAPNIKIGALTLSLDDIEHKIIRPLGDARTHFALNCASVSCPTLRAKPYVQASLAQTLDEQTQMAFYSPLHIRPTTSLLGGKKLGISKIFKWYEEDFNTKTASLTQFLKKYTVPTLQKELEKGVTYVTYNWDLNTAKNINTYLAELNEKNFSIRQTTQ